MAEISHESVLRHPLTTILGAKAHVRVLRELFAHGGELSAPALVRRTGLAQSSVREALMGLEPLGIVRALGQGRVRLYRVACDHPLSAPLEVLFQAEEERYQAILDAIRNAVREFGDDVLAAWLYGSVARGEDGPTSDVDIAVVIKADEVSRVADGIRERLMDAEDRLVFHLSVVPVDEDDVRRLDREGDPWWRDIQRDGIALIGPRPEELLRRLRSR
ncbi:nucleotidyltransferase domain-containing protein [Thalassobaculum sp.]|uniref:nucleotidyltransferase domain-containing protein n=1 Tax=Thalassobaculum sp. TaxID=2022740 RepID=UPI0032ED6F8A